MAPAAEGGANGNGPKWRVHGYAARPGAGQEPHTATAEATEPAEATQHTLQGLLARGGKLPLPAALCMLDDVLGALERLHRLGLIHGQVRPAAIAIDSDGHCRLDGGAAPPEARGHGGGLRYTAPEVLFRGERWTASTDLYAVAVVLFEALTGQPPLLGSESIADAPIPIMARSLLEEGLARDPGARPRSAGRFQQDLSVAADAFLGANWRSGGRAWLSAAMRALQSDRDLVGAPWGRRAPAEPAEEPARPGRHAARAPASAEPADGLGRGPVLFLGRPLDRRQRLTAGGILAAVGVVALLVALVVVGGSSPSHQAPSLPATSQAAHPSAQASPSGGAIFGTPAPTAPPETASPSASPTPAPTPVPAQNSAVPVVPPVVTQRPQPTPTSCLLLVIC